jgi:hypothetical protein
MIKFRDLRRWKYKLTEPCQFQVGIKPAKILHVPAVDSYVTLRVDGALLIKEGYTWDGPSGPAPDLRCSMRGSLVHDALYQLMRSGKLSIDHRLLADNALRELLEADGMSRWLAWAHWVAVRLFAAKRAEPQLELLPAVRTAP